jgi:ABC-type antimicrobial peptide transport system permease subunit
MGGLSQLFAQLTLAVAGIGVFTVTYLNVKERTMEIGLRMAIGAKRRDIAILFITEACSLSLAGGVLGVLAGWIGSEVLILLTDWKLVVDLRSVAAPFALSVAIGLVFGAIPAIKASKLVPVAALSGA